MHTFDVHQIFIYLQTPQGVASETERVLRTANGMLLKDSVYAQHVVLVWHGFREWKKRKTSVWYIYSRKV